MSLCLLILFYEMFNEEKLFISLSTLIHHHRYRSPFYQSILGRVIVSISFCIEYGCSL